MKTNGSQARLRVGLLLSTLLTTGALTACSPKVYVFQASPTRLCAGQSTTLTWKIRGAGLLTSVPSLPGTGPVGDSGARSFLPTDTTHFSITATKGGKVAQGDVVVIPFQVGVEKSLRFRADSLEDTMLVALGDLASEDWDSAVRIRSVADTLDRPLRVTHAGKDVELQAGGAVSESLKGTPVSGHWELRAPRLSREIAGATSPPPRDRLGVLLTLDCGK
jgi:hypothetical protein